MHARVPISCFVLNAWANISIDLVSFMNYCYPTSQFKSIDFISLKASCMIWWIFTMNLPLRDDTGYDDENIIRFEDVPIKI